MQTKICSGCKEIKSLNEFCKNKTFKDGLEYYCKKCRKEYKRKHYQKNREKLIEYQKEYYQKNREKIIKRNSEYQKNNRAQKRQWFYNIKSKLKCEICGENHIATLVFHHRNPKEKEIDMGKVISQHISKKRILKEIKKCQILCANCHRKLHWKEKNG